MAKLFYSFAPLPRQWPGRQRPAGWKPNERPLFKVTTLARTELLLKRELDHLGAKDVVVHVDVDPAQWVRAQRADGGIYSDVKFRSSRIIVRFSDKHGVMREFPADKFGDWTANLQAVARTLERLRGIDREGVTRGEEQYVGFKALPSAASDGMSLDTAVTVLARESGLEADAIHNYVSVARTAARIARAKTHPDSGREPDAEAFNDVQEAARVLARDLGYDDL